MSNIVLGLIIGLGAAFLLYASITLFSTTNGWARTGRTGMLIIGTLLIVLLLAYPWVLAGAHP